MGNIPNIGVYLCTCEGGIEQVIDLDSLADEVSGWDGVTAVRKDACLCSAEAIESIRKDVESGTVERVLIAACSPFLKREEFSRIGINRYLTERVNIREQCSMPHHGSSVEAIKKARELLKVFLEGHKSSIALQPLRLPASNTAVVIGGGISGINAALDLAGTGSTVYIIEKGHFLGGRVAELHSYFPRMCPPSCGLELMTEGLRENPAIHILTASEVDAIEGLPGNLDITINTSRRYISENCTLCGKCPDVCPSEAILYPEGFSYPKTPAIIRERCEEGCKRCVEVCPVNAIDLSQEDTSHTLMAGAVILATGWEPFDPSPITELGYGRIGNVITNMDLEGILKEQKIPADETKTIAFIQCVGSRDERYLPYCSDVCCMVSIKQALLLKESIPERDIYIFHNDIRTPGEYEELYQRARKEGIIFIKGTPSELKQEEDGKVSLQVFDTLTGERLDLKTDLVVLAVGMKPSGSNIDLRDKLGIPLNRNNFVESHLQCFPQDTQREGIFSAGCCRSPMDVSRSIESAGAASVKAFKFLNGEIEVSPDYPVVNTLKCDICKRCVEECPFKAFSFDEKGFPVAELTRCRQCGICMGGCPLSAISLGGLSIGQLSDMIDALDKNYLGEDEPVVLGFLCSNDAYRAVDDAGMGRITYPPNFIGIMVPCAGAVNGTVIAKAISSGIDGVLVAGCPENQCHYVQGSALAKARLKDISDKLKDMYLEPERVRFINISRDEAGRFAVTVTDYVRELRAMGRNPLRINE